MSKRTQSRAIRCLIDVGSSVTQAGVITKAACKQKYFIGKANNRIASSHSSSRPAPQCSLYPLHFAVRSAMYLPIKAL